MAKRAPVSHALILVCGAPGAGKSTLAAALLRRLPAVCLNSDDVIDAFFPGDRASAAFRRANPKFFAAIYALARRNERRDRPKLADWNGFLADLPPDFRVPFPHAVIDMERPLARCVAAALAHIARPRAVRCGS